MSDQAQKIEGLSGNESVKSRKLEFEYGDRFSPIRDLRPFDTVEITDDKERILKATVGDVREEPYHDAKGESTLVERALYDIQRFDGVDLQRAETILPGLYLEGVSEIPLSNLRKPGEKKSSNGNWFKS